MTMLPRQLLLLCFAIATSRARTSDTTSSALSTLMSYSAPAFTGSEYTYASPTSQITVDTSAASASSNGTASSTGTSSSTGSQTTRSSKTESLTQLVGGGGTSTNSNNGTASRTSSAALPSNTLPCNGYPEFCNRKYSNITEVCAHNSAFAIKNNVGSNQEYGVTDQLNDGIRMIQGETHWVNDTIYSCHTSCDLLNAGTFQSELETIVQWVQNNPYDVVTILVVNSDFRKVEDYIPPIMNSGIRQYLYEPTYVPQHLDQWPTLGEMIISGKRVVLFMDYNANQTAVPYILNEFTHMWETPYSPTDQNFPCSQQRPPNLGEEKARDQFMYLANHNLNTAIDVAAILGSGMGSGSDAILVPNTAEINQTNGVYETFGQLGKMNQNCTEIWGRPPNFLLVDYYNRGDPVHGSVFEVAAKANGVTYNRKCCGPQASSAPVLRSSILAFVAAFSFAVWVV